MLRANNYKEDIIKLQGGSGKSCGENSDGHVTRPDTRSLGVCICVSQWCNQLFYYISFVAEAWKLKSSELTHLLHPISQVNRQGFPLPQITTLQTCRP